MLRCALHIKHFVCPVSAHPAAASAKNDKSSAAPALSDVLGAVAVAVSEVHAGRSLSEALERVPAVLRPATQDICFHVMRSQGWAQAVRTRLVPRKPPSKELDALLLTALSLLAEGAQGAEAGPRYAPHTVVDQAVRAASADRRMAPAKGMVNAVLRRFLRERDEVQVDLPDEARWNFPRWWIARMQRAYPDTWQSLLQEANRQPPMTLRVNRRRTARTDLLARFEAAGSEASALGESGVLMAQPLPVARIPGFQEGWWSVQDLGAQMAAPLLGVRDGMRVLDACAAPGGKTAHMLELADVRMTALDADAGRLARVGQNLDRLGLMSPHVDLRAADAADPDAWWDGEPYDAILADVPCTASGIVRRHPDIRWLRRREDVARTAALQQRIVDALWQTLAPGGQLLYATCSVFPEEGEAQAQAFAIGHADAVRLDAPGQLLPLPEQGQSRALHDGFFYALFAKSR
ncbi:16S rRNA (cytosine(967)-C(5))-methyltransferase RsmB [Alcaligenaceae bacterium SJ-26]|nr:16S rRNA (cytosine(967)-C(5))-methyltransferase RsmB [Alcaligenaceae bacterium SJ-26]